MFTQIINKIAFAANTDKRYISDDIYGGLNEKGEHTVTNKKEEKKIFC